MSDSQIIICPVCGEHKLENREFCMTCLDYQDKAQQKKMWESGMAAQKARIEKWGPL